MAVAALPEPARSLKHPLSFPLENKKFVIDQMDFDIVDDNELSVVLAPIRVSILNSNFQVQLEDRFRPISEDIQNLERIRIESTELASAVEAHMEQINRCTNSIGLRISADKLIHVKADLFGQTNAGSAYKLVTESAKPAVIAEESAGYEGKLLVRMHVYKERDRGLVKRAKDYYRNLHGGKLMCEACGTIPVKVYGDAGERSIEAHHKIPIEELQPDSETRTSDLAMVCSNCHRVIHSKTPCLTVEEVRHLIDQNSDGNNVGAEPSTANKAQ